MQTEQNRAGEFLISEGNGDISREVVTVVAGHDMKAGTLLGKVTASGKYAPYVAGNSDGTETAVAILHGPLDTSATGLNADKAALVLTRLATVDLNMLFGHDAAGEVDLNAAMIIVR